MMPWRISLCVTITLAGLSLGAAPPPAAVPILSDGDAWDQLPRRNPPLPIWARALAGSLPRATTGMLELDYLHRVNNPLGPVLAAKLRWAAADAIGCEHARRIAEADLRRAVSADGTKRNPTLNGVSTAERAAIAFARQLTLAGHEVTDEQMAELLELFGPEKLVALVHTVALANFQNRIYLALGAEIDLGEPLPPLDVQFDPTREPRVAAPKRKPWSEAAESLRPTFEIARIDWGTRSFDELDRALEQQKARKSRIPPPDAERMARIPPEAKQQASRVVWTTISMGYQPRMTKAWFDTMRLFQAESQLDSVFSNTLFWVVTRSNECFY